MAVTITTSKPKRQRVAPAISFPYTDISDAFAVAEGLMKGGGVALSRDQLAAAMNMAPRGGGFATKMATARMFGVIPLSTTAPDEVLDFHCHFELAKPLPAPFDRGPIYKRDPLTWVP